VPSETIYFKRGEKMVICSEKFGNLIVKELTKNQDSVMAVNLKDLKNGRYCVTVRVYRVAMNLNEVLKFTKIAEEYGVEFQISISGGYFNFEYY
jgi:hypothetical protein